MGKNWSRQDSLLKKSTPSITAQLDSFFLTRPIEEALSGNIVVVDQGKQVYKKSFGFANLEARLLNTDSTQFQLASVSKTVTAVAVLQLYETGKLTLDDALVRFFPTFPYPAITIRQLLSHTSGLPDLSLFKQAVQKDPDKVCTNQELIPELIKLHLPLRFIPGEKWSYSNVNFDLLVLLVEKITRQGFSEYLTHHIFKPAHMSHTYIKTALINAAHQANEAHNYDYPFLFSTKLVRISDAFWLPRFKIQYHNLYGFVGDGSLYSTTTDLALFDQALYADNLLKPATLQEAFTPTKLTNGQLANASIGLGQSSYGLGWFILQDTTAGKIVYHTGGRAGCLTILMRNLQKKQLVALLVNTEQPRVYQDGVSVMNLLNQRSPLLFKRSIAAEYGRDLVQRGSDFAIGHLLSLKADSLHYKVIEADLNSLGYQLLSNGYTEQALEAFKVTTLLFPASANAYDSYGEALLKLGKKEEALKLYQRSVSLNPANEEGRAIVKQLSTK